MNRDEAKTYLQARRLDGQDDLDLRMAEALEWVGRDPELRAWHQAQRALDTAIGAKLRQVQAPPGLAGQILAQAKEARGRRRRRMALTLALAASLVILLSIAFQLVWHHPAATSEFAEMRADMEKFLVKFPELDLATEQWPEIVRWLLRNPALTQVDLPPDVPQFPGLGCREIRWRGKRLMLVCFAMQGEVVHLFVLPSKELSGSPLARSAAFTGEHGWNTASWSKGDTVYLMMSRGKMKFLRELVGGVDRI